MICGNVQPPSTEPKTTKSTELRKHTVRKSLEEMRVHEGVELEEEKARKAKLVVRPHLPFAGGCFVCALARSLQRLSIVCLFVS